MQVRGWSIQRIVAASVAVGVLVSLAVATSRPERYESKAVLEQRTNNSEDVPVAFRKALNADFDKLRTDISVVRQNGGRLFEVSFRSSDAGQAHATNSAIVQKLIDLGNFGLVAPASKPQRPLGPMYSLVIAWGIGGGLALGGTAALWMRYRVKFARPA